MVLWLVLAECWPAPPVDAKAPAFKSAPTDARPLLGLIWRAADLPQLRTLMPKEFTWSFGGDSDADQAISEWAKDPAFLKSLRTALTGTCKAEKDTLTCKGKKGPRLVLERGKDRCWQWTAFVDGD